MHVRSVDVSQLCFLHTCAGLRFLASRATDPELRDASVLILCTPTDLSDFVVDYAMILTEIEKVGKLTLKFMAHFEMDVCSSLAA